MQTATRLDAKTQGEKVLLRKFASSIRDFCRGLWYRKSLLLIMVQLPRKRQDVVTCQGNNCQNGFSVVPPVFADLFIVWSFLVSGSFSPETTKFPLIWCIILLHCFELWLKRFWNDAAINNFTNKAEKFLVIKVTPCQNVIYVSAFT